MKTITEIIEILQGFEAGRKVQSANKYGRIVEWENDDAPVWNFEDCDYRLAPEPKLVPYGPEDGAFLVLRKTKAMNAMSYGFIMTCGTGDVTISTTDNDKSFHELFTHYLDVTDDPNGVPFGKVVE